MNDDFKTFILNEVRMHPNMRAHSLEEKIRKWDVRRKLKEETDSFKRLCDDMAANLNRRDDPRRGLFARFRAMFFTGFFDGVF